MIKIHYLTVALLSVHLLNMPLQAAMPFTETWSEPNNVEGWLTDPIAGSINQGGGHLLWEKTSVGRGSLVAVIRQLFLGRNMRSR